MKLREYIESLSQEEQDEYAIRAGTTGNHLRMHLKHARKIPRLDLMMGLWEGSKGRVSRQEVLDHFYP